MAFPTIKVGDNLLQDARLTSAEVRQMLNEHWWCTFVCAQTDDAPIPVAAWLGQPLTVTTTDEQKAPHTHFTGFILSVDLLYEASGTYSAKVMAVSHSWLLDQANHKQYYLAKTLSDIATIAVGRVGLSASIKVPSAKPLNYVQYGETDFSFLQRIVDDYKAWMRPMEKGVEVFGAFQTGVDLPWRGGSGFGLLQFTLGGTLKSATFNGSHYDHHVMASKTFQQVGGSPNFYSDAAGLVSAVQAQSSSLMPSGFVQQRPRVMTLGDFETSIQDESERSMGSSVLGHGSSRTQELMAGNTVNITGSLSAAGMYGLIQVTHRWTGGGYGNEFTCTPWKQFHSAHEPPVRAWNGVVSARVVDHNDPKKMGRIKVQFFWQGDGATHWARATAPHAGPDRGFMFMPEVGDEVAVAFEDGDPERPVILGSLWNGVQQAPRGGFFAPEANIPENDVKRLMTKSGNRLQMVDAPGQETMVVATPNHNHVTLTEKSTGTGRSLVHIHSDGDIVLSAPNGRVHVQSQFFSREIGAAAPAIAPVPSTPAPASGSGAASKESYMAGLGGGLWNSTVTPLVDLVKHPIKALEGIAHVAAHPWDSGKAIAHATADTGKDILHGDGRALGTAIGSVGMLFVPGAGEAEAAEDVARVSKLGQVAETAEVASDTSKVGGVADAAETGSEVIESTPHIDTSAEPGASSPSNDLPASPDDLTNQGYNETTHPDAGANGRRTFENPDTGDTVHFDEGTPGEPGYRGKDHYHRENPASTGKKDLFLDSDGNPVAKGSKRSHLPPSQ